MCSTACVLHFRRPDTPEIIASIVRAGLQPLSSLPEHPEHAIQLSARRNPFEQCYRELAASVLGDQYPGRSGVFFTTIDFRLLPDNELARRRRIRTPIERLDPESTVLTYMNKGTRTHRPLTAHALATAARI